MGRQVTSLSLMTAVPIIAAINLYGFIITLLLILPGWLCAMNLSVDAIVRTTRARRWQAASARRGAGRR